MLSSTTSILPLPLKSINAPLSPEEYIRFFKKESISVKGLFKYKAIRLAGNIPLRGMPTTKSIS